MEVVRRTMPFEKQGERYDDRMQPRQRLSMKAHKRRGILKAGIGMGRGAIANGGPVARRFDPGSVGAGARPSTGRPPVRARA